MATVRTRISLTLAAMLAMTASCTGRGSYASFSTIGNNGWAYGDTLAYVANTTDSILNGPLVVSICHDDDYVYANIWLELTYRANDSARTTCRDTVNVPLANRHGHWYGSGFGTTFQTTDTVKNHFTLTRGDTLLLRHIMRVDTLNNISQIGLSLKPDNR